MEFEGRITRVLPAVTGTRADGTQWKDLSFVFSYFENPTDRYEDAVLVRTFDTKIMAKIAPYLMKDAEGKVIIEDDALKLIVEHIPARCGWGNKVKVFKKKDGSGFTTIQESRSYRLEIIQPAGNPAGTVAQPQAASAPQYQQAAEALEDPDDLPF